LCKARWVWAGAVTKICVLATCSWQFAKAGSVVTLPQQEKSNSEDLHRDRVHIPGFV
jgi:hypothetical protein